jgi:hypothetical protein
MASRQDAKKLTKSTASVGNAAKAFAEAGAEVDKVYCERALKLATVPYPACCLTKAVARDQASAHAPAL